MARSMTNRCYTYTLPCRYNVLNVKCAYLNWSICKLYDRLFSENGSSYDIDKDLCHQDPHAVCVAGSDVMCCL